MELYMTATYPVQGGGDITPLICFVEEQSGGLTVTLQGDRVTVSGPLEDVTRFALYAPHVRPQCIGEPKYFPLPVAI